MMMVYFVRTILNNFLQICYSSSHDPGKYPAAWVSKSYENAFTHELGHILGARKVFLIDNRFCF